MLKGIVFDMDGLIFNSERVVQRTWKDVGGELGYPDMGDQIYNTIGFNRDRRKVYFENVYGDDFPYAVFAEKTRVRFEEIVEEEGLPLKPGAREILAYIKERKLKIGLATSASEDYAGEELKGAGIYQYFDGFVFGNMVTKSKPDKEVYVKACAAIGIEPEEAIALEDAPSGVESAFTAGLRVIMVPDLVQPNQETRAKTWKVADTLHEVIEILKDEDMQGCTK